MPSAGPPGWAYVRAEGVAAISPDGKVTKVKALEGTVSHLSRASDGRVHAIAVDDAGKTFIHVIEEDRARPVGALQDCRATVGASLDARGDRMVLACSRKVFEGSGSSWTVIDPPVETYDALVWISADRSVWFADEKGIWQRKTSEWRQIPGANPGAKPEGVVQAAGSAWLAAADKILEVRETGVRIAHEKSNSFSLPPASNGLMGFWSGEGQLLLYTTAGLVKTGAVKGWIERGHLDDTGRAWGARDGQLQVADPLTGEVTVLPMGAYPALDKLTISSNVVVVGSGPKVPSIREVRKTKKIAGRIMLNGEPLADAAIELCPRGNWVYSGKTPCSGVDPAVVRTTTTDSKGSFSVGESPMGLYHVHYRAKGAEKWAIDSAGLELRENQATELGTLRYESRK